MNWLRQWLMNHDRSKLAFRWALSATVLTACGCNAAARRPVAKATPDPFLSDNAPALAATDESGRVVLRQHTVARPPGPVQQAGGESKPPALVQQASGDYEETGRGANADGAITRIGGEMRLPDNPNCPCPVIDESPCASAKDFPDEYLCDGGDRDLPISYTEDEMQGLETEDAAVEYRDDLNKRHVKPTNKVCIYAPRFASVSSISEPIEDVGGGRPVQAIAAQTGAGLANREGTFAQHQRDATERLVTRQRGSGVTTDASAEAVEQPIAPSGHAHTADIAQEFTFLRTGQVKQADEARLAASITAALALSRNQNPVITAKSEQGIELRNTFLQRELVGQENRHNGHGMIRVVKLVDQKLAVPGDVVTFTIRYDNIGDREVHDVVIVDNLTPRLEYVDDSAECDAAGHLDIEDNGEGSVILRWVLDEPVPGRKGGVVSFKALVR
jgi:uncharacterized repeat protein (TIGR01451 family)